MGCGDSCLNSLPRMATREPRAIHLHMHKLVVLSSPLFAGEGIASIALTTNNILEILMKASSLKIRGTDAWETASSGGRLVPKAKSAPHVDAKRQSGILFASSSSV